MRYPFSLCTIHFLHPTRVVAAHYNNFIELISFLMHFLCFNNAVPVLLMHDILLQCRTHYHNRSRIRNTRHQFLKCKMHIYYPVFTCSKCHTYYYNAVHVIITRSIFETCVANSYNAQYIILIMYRILQFAQYSKNASPIILIQNHNNVMRCTLL
jgi:hypothetical protein